MKTNINKTNMKKGITLIEIILAIVLIAIILGVTIPKLMTNSAKAEIRTVITSDVKSIIESAETWRKTSSLARKTFETLDAAALNSRLPSNMIISFDGEILSSGLKTGILIGDPATTEDTGVKYLVTWNFTGAAGNALNKTSEFSIAMDVSDGANSLNWDDKLQAYAQEVFRDTIVEMTSGADANSAARLVTNGNTISSVPAGGAVATYTCNDATTTCMDGVQAN